MLVALQHPCQHLPCGTHSLVAPSQPPPSPGALTAFLCLGCRSDLQVLTALQIPLSSCPQVGTHSFAPARVATSVQSLLPLLASVILTDSAASLCTHSPALTCCILSPPGTQSTPASLLLALVPVVAGSPGYSQPRSYPVLSSRSPYYSLAVRDAFLLSRVLAVRQLPSFTPPPGSSSPLSTWLLALPCVTRCLSSSGTHSLAVRVVLPSPECQSQGCSTLASHLRRAPSHHSPMRLRYSEDEENLSRN